MAKKKSFPKMSGKIRAVLRSVDATGTKIDVLIRAAEKQQAISTTDDVGLSHRRFLYLQNILRVLRKASHHLAEAASEIETEEGGIRVDEKEV